MHIASGYSDCSEAIIEAGGVAVLVEHITLENHELSENVCDTVYTCVCVCVRACVRACVRVCQGWPWWFSCMGQLVTLGSFLNASNPH